MEAHKRILGILYIVSGALQILVLTILYAVLSSLLPIIFEQEDQLQNQWILVWIVPFLGTIIASTVILIAIPSIIGGVALLNRKKWALTLILILGCFKLFSVPVGTAIGIYTIWVYTEEHRRLAQTS